MKLFSCYFLIYITSRLLWSNFNQVISVYCAVLWLLARLYDNEWRVLLSLHTIGYEESRDWWCVTPDWLLSTQSPPNNVLLFIFSVKAVGRCVSIHGFIDRAAMNEWMNERTIRSLKECSALYYRMLKYLTRWPGTIKRLRTLASRLYESCLQAMHNWRAVRSLEWK